MDDLQKLGMDILSETIADLKDEYDGIPASVKAVMPTAAVLVAEGVVTESLSQEKSRDLKHAMSILANVKIGGQIALNELLLQKAEDILARGFKFLRNVIGL